MCYQIKPTSIRDSAVSDCGVSEFSNAVTGTGVFEPSIPGKFTAIPDGNKILLNWVITIQMKQNM